MPTLPLPIPDNRKYRSKAFRAIVAQLQSDSILQGVVRTWAAWDGRNPQVDVALPVGPNCPWIRLTPYPETQEAGAIEIDHAPLVLMVEFAVEGTLMDNLMDFWECIEASIRTDSLSVDGALTFQNHLQNYYRVHRVQVMQPAFGAIRANAPGQVGILYGKGLVKFTMDVPR